jgi:hypothetical protein
VLAKIEGDPAGDASSTIACPRVPLGEQGGLADAWIAADEDRGRSSLCSFVQSVVECGQLDGPTHERRAHDPSHGRIIGPPRRGFVRVADHVQQVRRPLKLVTRLPGTLSVLRRG